MSDCIHTSPVSRIASPHCANSSRTYRASRGSGIQPGKRSPRGTWRKVSRPLGDRPDYAGGPDGSTESGPANAASSSLLQATSSSSAARSLRRSSPLMPGFNGAVAGPVANIGSRRSGARSCGADSTSRSRSIVLVPVVSVDRRQRGASAPDRLHKARALLAQNALYAADSVALAIQQVAHAAQQIDIFGTVEAPSSAPLHRPDLCEPAFPKAQYVLRHIDFVGNLADGAECPRRLVHWPVPRKDACPSRPSRQGLPVRVGIDPLLKNRGRFEHHHAPR